MLRLQRSDWNAALAGFWLAWAAGSIYGVLIATSSFSTAIWALNALAAAVAAVLNGMLAVRDRKR